MSSLLRKVGVTAKVNPAEDETVDDEVVLAERPNGDSLSIQCGAGYYSLNRWVEAEGAMHHMQTVPQAASLVQPALAALKEHFPEVVINGQVA